MVWVPGLGLFSENKISVLCEVVTVQCLLGLPFPGTTVPHILGCVRHLMLMRKSRWEHHSAAGHEQQPLSSRSCHRHLSLLLRGGRPYCWLLWTQDFLFCKPAQSESQQAGDLFAEKNWEEKISFIPLSETWENHSLHFRAFMFRENKKWNEFMKD